MRTSCLILTVLAASSLASSATPATHPASTPVFTVASADGVPIAYEVHGTAAPALVLVHGWSCDRSYWKEQVDELSPQFQLVLIDLAGHGASGQGRKSYTIESFGDDVAAVVEKLDLKDVVLVGHSMGGDVIVAAAKRLRGRVSGLVWVDDYKSLEQPSSDEQVQAFVGKFRKDFRRTTDSFVRGMFGGNADPKLVDRVAKDMASAPPAVALSALESSFTYARTVSASLDELKLPVAAINSDKEPTDYDSLGKHGVKARVLPDVGHFIPLEDPPRFNRTLSLVVRSLSQ
jgi:pimeloyl-ACP methyl ester carboxylesterase